MLIDASVTNVNKIVRYCLNPNEHEKFETELAEVIGRRFAANLFKRTATVRNLTAKAREKLVVQVPSSIYFQPRERERDINEVDACFDALGHVIQLKIDSVNLANVLAALTDEPEGPARAEAAAQLQRAQQLIAPKLKQAEAHLAGTITALRHAVNSSAPAAPAPTPDPDLQLSSRMNTFVRIALGAAREAVTEDPLAV